MPNLTFNKINFTAQNFDYPIGMERFFVKEVCSPNQKFLNIKQWIELLDKYELIKKYKKKLKKMRKSIKVTFPIFISVFLGINGSKEDFSFELKI
jgi:hypothetical protein